MPTTNSDVLAALKSGKISQSQYDSLPERLLIGIANRKSVFQKGRDKKQKRAKFVKEIRTDIQKKRGKGLGQETGFRPSKTKKLKATQKAERRLLKNVKVKPTQSKSVFAAGRAKKERKEKFLEGAKQFEADLVSDAIKDSLKELKKLEGSKRGRKKKGAAPDRSKSELYAIAKMIKNRDDRVEPISVFDKTQLKRFVLKFE
tara:strand:+ start:3128 stop:3733 length:606 start_codon:yes stop_codon:yes gene_type:complete